MPPVALALFAHPDDETLACGGTLASMVARGWTVQVAYVGDGVVTARDAVQDNQADAAAACQELGVAPPVFVGYPDQRLDGEVVSDVVNATRDVTVADPDLVLTHSENDLNRDHQVVSHVARVLSRPVGRACALVECEVPANSVWNGRPFLPNWYVDITDHLDQKLAALACYGNESRVFPHPYSPDAIEAVARAHGAASGLACAEAFRVVRGYAGQLP